MEHVRILSERYGTHKYRQRPAYLKIIIPFRRLISLKWIRIFIIITLIFLTFFFSLYFIILMSIEEKEFLYNQKQH